MPEQLTPPIRYNNGDDDHNGGKIRRKKHRSVKTRDGEIVKLRKSFGGITVDDIFITGGFDVVFFALVMIILSIGLVMLFSASYPTSYFESGNSYGYFLKQLVFAAIGIGLMLFISKLNHKVIQAFVNIMLGVSIGLLMLVLVYHTDLKSASGEVFRRYIPIGSFSFQPSDIAKFTIVTTLASYFCKYSGKIKTFKYGIMYPFIIIGVFCGLILLENHLSGTLIMGIIGISVMWAAGSDKRLFIVGICIMLAGIIVAAKFPQFLPEYIQDKLDAFTNKGDNLLGNRWQNTNALYAIGSGGFFGMGLGNSKQKYLYVSEPQNDFIFSIVCEELGFLGAVIIIALFAALVIQGFKIALRCNDMFASLVVLGIIAQIGLQVGLNILVVTDVIPNTGVALPFFSSGGTALVMHLAEMGVVLCVSRRSNQKRVQLDK